MCQRHNRAIKDLGLASAFFLVGQVSQAKVFSVGEVGLVSISLSFIQQDQVEATDSAERSMELSPITLHLFDSDINSKCLLICSFVLEGALINQD